MNNVYCTYFNKGYLSRGIVLIRSLSRVDPGFRIEVLCFDDATYDFLVSHNLGNVIPCRLADFESRHPELVAVKPSRTRGEYFFTCTSSWTLDVILRNKAADMVTYLDADMKFFTSPAGVFDSFHDKDILICDHHFERDAELKIVYGRYNVGWISFRNNQTGIKCLSKWASDCVDWCYDRLEDGKFADQKYLDAWPALYGDSLAVAPRSLNLGPWGIGNGEFSVREGAPCICGEPIVLYHFQGLRLFGRRHYYLGYYYHHSVSEILEFLYEPYIRELQSVEREFGIASANSRYSNGSLPYRLFTGYWLGHPHLSDIHRRFVQRILL